MVLVDGLWCFGGEFLSNFDPFYLQPQLLLLTMVCIYLVYSLLCFCITTSWVNADWMINGSLLKSLLKKYRCIDGWHCVQPASFVCMEWTWWISYVSGDVKVHAIELYSLISCGNVILPEILNGLQPFLSFSPYSGTFVTLLFNNPSCQYSGLWAVFQFFNISLYLEK